MTYFAKYVVVGSTALVLHLAILKFLIKTFHVLPVAASAAGFIVACIANYFLQHTVVFSSIRPMAKTARRYVLVTSALLGVNSVLFMLFNSVIGASPMLAQIAATGCVFVANFFFNRHFTFSPRGPAINSI